MRIAAFGATLLFAFAACSTTSDSSSESPFLQPNSLMTGEITRRVEQIPYQHRDELLQNLLWLAQTGEQTIPALLEGLRHENAKVRSSSAWVLGRLRDRRTIPALQAAVRDEDQTVRMECARTLVLLGDLSLSPALIEGLDSEKKEVRYMCHEALKVATGHDFGYDHLNQNDTDLKLSVLRWRQWWSEYSGDTFFAANYQRQHRLDAALAAPMGETKPVQVPEGNNQPQGTPDGVVPPLTPGNDGAQGTGPGATDGAAPMPVQQPVQQPVQTPVPAPAPAVRPNGGK